MEVLSVDCPICDSPGLSSHQKFFDIPHFGEVMVSTINCSSCGYRHADVLPTTTRTPRRYIFRFDDESGLNARVIRSGSSTVRMPDLGVRIDPGGASEGYITNIEGLLMKILGIIDHLRSDLTSSIGHPESDSADIKLRIDRSIVLRKRIESIIGGQIGTTVIIEDPYGNSAIIQEENDDKTPVIVEDLSEAEILALLGTDGSSDS